MILHTPVDTIAIYAPASQMLQGSRGGTETLDRPQPTLEGEAEFHAQSAVLLVYGNSPEGALPAAATSGEDLALPQQVKVFSVAQSRQLSRTNSERIWKSRFMLFFSITLVVSLLGLAGDFLIARLQDDAEPDYDAVEP